MAVRPRVSSGSVDLVDTKEVVEEVVEENEVLYDMTYNTMIDAYTEPLKQDEIDRIVGRLDMQALAALVAVDPAGATALLRSAREGL